MYEALEINVVCLATVYQAELDSELSQPEFGNQGECHV